MRISWAWMVVVALAACSAESGDDDDDSSGGAGGTGNVGTGGTSTGGAPGGHTSTGGSGASAGGGSGQDMLFPLGLGHGWTYTVQPVGAGSVCAAGQHAADVVGSEMLDGRTAYEVTNWCTGVPDNNLYAYGTGDEVLLYYQGDWLTVIDPNLVEGHTWSYFNTSFTWHQEPAVTVPAGTYSDCWTAQQNVSYTAFTTYCRGVGPVRSYSEDLSGAGWDAQLTGTNF